MHFLKTQLFQKVQLQKAEPNSPSVKLELTQQLKRKRDKGGRNFGPLFIFASSFFFFTSSLHFHLLFLHCYCSKLHSHCIFSSSNHFSKLPNLIFIIPLNISPDPWVFEYPWKTHFWNPFSNLHLLLSFMAFPPGPPKFRIFHGKRYNPSIEWNDEERLLQDPINHAL